MQIDWNNGNSTVTHSALAAIKLFFFTTLVSPPDFGTRKCTKVSSACRRIHKSWLRPWGPSYKYKYKLNVLINRRNRNYKSYLPLLCNQTNYRMRPTMTAPRKPIEAFDMVQLHLHPLKTTTARVHILLFFLNCKRSFFWKKGYLKFLKSIVYTWARWQFSLITITLYSPLFWRTGRLFHLSCAQYLLLWKVLLL